MHEAGVMTPLAVTTSVEQAIEYLSGINGYSNWHQFPLPSIVLLDLKMSRSNFSMNVMVVLVRS
jgi:hypothetical protein